MPQLFSVPVCSQLLFLLARRTARGSRTTIRYALQKSVQVRAPTFTCKISIVRRSSERDGLGRTGKHVRDRVGKSLESVRIEPDFIEDDVVVCGADCALKTVVRLKEEIEICPGCSLVSCQCGSCLKARLPYTAVIPLSTTVPGLGFPF